MTKRAGLIVMHTIGFKGLYKLKAIYNGEEEPILETPNLITRY